MSIEKPRFRRDLEARPVLVDGQRYVEVNDVAAERTFRLYDFEYQVALAFDGLPLEKVIPWVKLATGLALQIEQLQEFAQRLDELGFLERASPVELPLSEVEAEPPAVQPTTPSEEPESVGPPEPDAVVMHRFEVVGETPPPVPVDTVPAVAPPPWTTPRPLLTPRPTTLGPALIADQPAARRRIRRSIVLFGTLGILAATALLAVTLPFVFSSRQVPPLGVRTRTVTPATVYRYFDGAAPIVAMPGPVWNFPAGGKVAHIVAKGSTVAAGDIVAAVEAARSLENRLTRHRERLAYYQQMAEAMHQAGSAKDEERQSAKVEARNIDIARIQRELARIAVVAASAGEVEEVLAHEGQSIEADSPAVRLRSPGFRVTFEFSRSQAALARRLGFCQVEVEGYLLDCNPAQSAGDETHVAVDLPSVPTVLVGKPAHLARARYRGAVVLPVIALQTSDSRTGVYIVATNARLEMRPVAVAERDDVEAIVVQGLDVGDKVAVEPSLGLRPGMLVGTPSGL